MSTGSGAGRFYADHDARHPWRLAYLLDRPNGEMTEGFADWLAAEWPVLLPEIAVAQPLHVRRWSEALSEGAFGDFAAPARFMAAILPDAAVSGWRSLSRTGAGAADYGAGHRSVTGR